MDEGSKKEMQPSLNLLETLQFDQSLTIQDTDQALQVYCFLMAGDQRGVPTPQHLKFLLTDDQKPYAEDFLLFTHHNEQQALESGITTEDQRFYFFENQILQFAETSLGDDPPSLRGSRHLWDEVMRENENLRIQLREIYFAREINARVCRHRNKLKGPLLDSLTHFLRPILKGQSAFITEVLNKIELLKEVEKQRVKTQAKLPEQQEVDAVIKGIDIVAKARSISQNYSEALFLAIQEAYLKLKELGIEMQEKDTIVLAQRFFDEGALVRLPQPLPPEAVNLWYTGARANLWQQRVTENPAISLGYKIESIAIDAIGNFRYEEAQHRTDTLIGRALEKAIADGIPDDLFELFSNTLLRLKAFPSIYLHMFKQEAKFIQYVLENIEYLSKEMFANRNEMLMGIDQLRQEIHKRFLPRFGMLIEKYRMNLSDFVGEEVSDDLTTDQLLDIYIDYWLGEPEESVH